MLKQFIGICLFVFGFVAVEAQIESIEISRNKVEGVSWERISSIDAAQLPDSSVVVNSPVDEQVMFIATRTGLYRSENGGYDWEKLPLPFDGNPAFAPAPDDLKTLYVADSNRVFRSTDGGQHWEKLSELKAGGIKKLAVHSRVSSLIYAAGGRPPRLLGDGGQAICYRSTDRGKTWQKFLLPDRIPVKWLVLHPINENVVYASTELVGRGGFIGGNVFRSDDSGETWQRIANGRRIPLVIHPEQPNRMATIYADQLRFDRIWFEFSLDGGRTWARGVGMNNQTVEQIALGVNPDTLYAVTGRGIYYSLNYGFTWRLLSNQLNASGVVALATNTDQWQIDGYEIRGLLVLTDFGAIYRLVIGSSRSVSQRGKATITWGILKRRPQK